MSLQPAAASYIYIHYALKKREKSGGGDVSRCMSRPAQALDRIIHLMRQPNTDSAQNTPVTLPRNQLLIRYAVTSPVHTVTILCYSTR